MKNRLRNDIWLYRTVVGSILGAILLAWNGFSTPEVIVALGSAAIGGLDGLLAPSLLNR